MGQRQTALLREVRPRSKSFTEGKTPDPSSTAQHDPLPPVLSHPSSPLLGWSSLPVTPRDSHHHHHEDQDDVISARHRQSSSSTRQRDVCDVGAPSEVSAGDVSSAIRHPRQQLVGDGGSGSHVTSYGERRDVISGKVVPESGCVSGGTNVRRVNGSVHDDGDDDDDFGGEEVAPGRTGLVSERRVQVNVEQHSRTYSEAWDAYDSEEETNSFENTENARETAFKSEDDGDRALADETWVSTRPGSDLLGIGSRTQAVAAATGAAAASGFSTLPRHRPPAPLQPAHSHSNVFSARHNAADSAVAAGNNNNNSNSNSRDEERLVRFSSSETLGRHPRGPVLKYFQRAARESAERSPSLSPRTFRLDSPRERSFVFPGECPGKASTNAEQISKETSLELPQNSCASSADWPVQPLKDSGEAEEVPRFTQLLSASSHKSSGAAKPGIPQAVKKSSSIPLRARSTSQGPPQGSRKSLGLALPASFASNSLSLAVPAESGQNPRTLSSGIPQVRPRSSSTGPNFSARKPLRRSAAVGSGIPKGSEISESSGILGGGKSGGRDVGVGGVHPMAVMELAARDLRCPAMQGFLCRKTFTDDWVRYFYVLQEDSLYCYITPDDYVTVDVTDLDGYSVTSLEDKFPGQRFVLHLQHEDYIPVYLSTSSREEMEDWHAALTFALKQMRRVNGLHLSQAQDEGVGVGTAHRGEERVLGIKQKLLAEVLRQTQELEKKQAVRLAIKQQSSLEESDLPYHHSPPATHPPPSPSSAGHPPSGEQICTLTRLRQRRMSTQIKMDTLQRQIHGSNGQSSKKSRFTFGKKKSVDEAHRPQHHPDLVQQLKTLSYQMSQIDHDLLQNGGVMTVDRKSASLPASSSSSSSLPRSSGGGRKLISRHSQDVEGWGGGAEGSRGGGGGVGGEGRKSGGGGRVQSLATGAGGEDGSIGRSNSLKTSVQKLAHRTFAKAGWTRGKKAYSLDREDSEEKPDNYHHHHIINNNNNNDEEESPPDVVDLSHRLSRTWPARDVSQESEEAGVGGGGSGSGEVFLPPPSSFDSGGGGDGGTPSPVSSPRSARSVGSGASSERGAGEWTMMMMSSGGSLLRRSVEGGSSRIPRRQLDPGARASIEAFEEMSRQILGEPT